MAERNTSGTTGTDDNMLSDSRNFEHGTVTDAVYVPHSKQSFRGHQRREKPSGNYRPGHQHSASWDRSEFEASNHSGARRKYGGDRVHRPFGRRGHYDDMRNSHSAAYEYRQFKARDQNLMDSSSRYSEPSVADQNVSLIGPSTDSSSDMQHVPYSRDSRKPLSDHRYKERNQTRDQNSKRRGRHVYDRGRSYRGAFNCVSDENLPASSTKNAPIFDDREAGGGVEIPEEVVISNVTEFVNSDLKKLALKTHYGGQLNPRADNFSVQRVAPVGYDSRSSHDEQPFCDYRVSNGLSSLPPQYTLNKTNGQSTSGARTKSDPEFETQRGC